MLYSTVNNGLLVADCIYAVYYQDWGSGNTRLLNHYGMEENNCDYLHSDVQCDVAMSNF